MSEENSETETVLTNAPLVIDLGKQKKSRIKSLRKGKGKLLDDVYECLEELKSRGVLGDHAQPVILVVKEKTAGFPW